VLGVVWGVGCRVLRVALGASVQVCMWTVQVRIQTISQTISQTPPALPRKRYLAWPCLPLLAPACLDAAGLLELARAWRMPLPMHAVAYLPACLPPSSLPSPSLSLRERLSLGESLRRARTGSVADVGGEGAPTQERARAHT
jgi:hypothetical protein